MNIQKMNKRELEMFVQELRLKNKEMTTDRDFWKARYNTTRGILDDHLDRLEKINEHA